MHATYSCALSSAYLSGQRGLGVLPGYVCIGKTMTCNQLVDALDLKQEADPEQQVTDTAAMFIVPDLKPTGRRT